MCCFVISWKENVAVLFWARQLAKEWVLFRRPDTSGGKLFSVEDVCLFPGPLTK